MAKPSNKTEKNKIIMPELSRIINVDDVVGASAPVTLEITANETEREALAKRFDLLSLPSLIASIRLETVAGFGAENNTNILATVKLKANLTQTCSVTLDPVEDAIDATFTQLFAPEGAFPEFDESEDDEFMDATDIDLDDFAHQTEHLADLPEPIIDGNIDLGELVAEELAVRINPFPRKKDVEFEWVSKNMDNSDTRNNPFAVLGGLKLAENDQKKPKK